MQIVPFVIWTRSRSFARFRARRSYAGRYLCDLNRLLKAANTCKRLLLFANPRGSGLFRSETGA